MDKTGEFVKRKPALSPLLLIYAAALAMSLICADLEASYVQARLWGRLGNHMFIVAAATSLALDHGAQTAFPDFESAWHHPENLSANHHVPTLKSARQKIFPHLNASCPCEPVQYVYQEVSFTYSPIPYYPHMLLEGWFQSEKYFIHHKQEIIELFSPSKEIVEYLNKQYSAILNHPNTVAVHLRCYHKENAALDSVFPTYGRAYFEKAISLFDREALFVVFSDQIEWAKEELKGIAKNMLFIEGEPYYHDFYLMSMCKHNVISNSSFSWWAAYLNKNSKKSVIVPPIWFCPEYEHDSSDLIPPDWLVLSLEES